VIVTKWQDKPIVVQGLGKAGSVSMLGYEGKVKYSASANKLAITPPAATPASNPCKYAWVFKVSGAF
jgi:alpha-L-fucosidase